ncbi:MAG: vitamin K epoxide reductase family protein [Acidobacteriaceae bacterium]
MSPRARRLLFAIALLSVCGMAVSSVSLYHHYGTSASSYCDFGDNFNCDIVNRSTYSVVSRVPVALIGILGYTALLGLATFYRTKAETPAVLLITSFAGLSFALYLTYVEAFVLATWCILCLSSLTIISAITMLSAVLAVQSVRRNA